MKVICSWNAVTPEEIRFDRVKSGDPWMSTPVRAFIWAQCLSFKAGLRRSMTRSAEEDRSY
jgi:hypothetical protein